MYPAQQQQRTLVVALLVSATDIGAAGRANIGRERVTDSGRVSPMPRSAAAVSIVGFAAVFVVTVAGCGASSGSGSLSGRLFLQNGPAVGGARPVSGTIVATGKSGRYVTTTTSDGRYRMRLPAGVYTVRGTSPEYHSNGSCVEDRKANVRAHQPTTVNVYCQIE